MSAPDQFLLYTAPNGAVKVDVFFKDETLNRQRPNLIPAHGQRPLGLHAPINPQALKGTPHHHANNTLAPF